MHELTIAREIVEEVCRESLRHGSARVRRILCRIGCLRQVDALLLEEAFQAARQGTPLEDAELTVVSVGVRLACEDCGRESETAEIQFSCPLCGSQRVELQGGEELELTSLELEVDDEDRSDSQEPAGSQRPDGCRESASV